MKEKELNRKQREIHFLWNYPSRIKVLEYLYYNKRGKNRFVISNELGITYMTAIKTTKQLEIMGLVEQRKLKKYYLTEKGKEITREILEIEKILK